MCVPVPSIVVKNWYVTVPVGVKAPTLALTDDGRAVVSDGCNTFSGTAAIDSSTLTITFEAQTDVLCAGAQADAASLVAATFAGPVTYRIEASRLTLMNSDVGLDLRA